MQLPKQGKSREELRDEIEQALGRDADWRGGKIWSLVYFAGDDVSEVMRDAYSAAIYTNGLGPGAFKSLRKFESEVIAMTAGLLDEVTACGNMTSGGTESILMAVKTARDYAKAERGITEPEMVLPITAHPAFDKSAQYLGVKAVHARIREDFRVDVDAMHELITPNTALLVGSAPNYPFGTIDDIPRIGAMALERGIPCHVDACLGGFLLPFVERLGYNVPLWDFRVPGVSSISADLHKYGFAARGASTIMYRDNAYRRHQFFTQTDWPGGLYGSPTMTGSRPGGAVAAAWAVMTYLGQEGYMHLAKVIMDTTRALMDGINAIDGVHVVGQPDMSVFAIGSDTIDIHTVGDALETFGWHPDRQQKPPALHFMVTPAHKHIVEPFLADLRESVRKVVDGEQAPGRGAAVYGALDKMVERGPIRDAVIGTLEKITQVEDRRV
ncbi:MAG: aspartate aminotransferase family protein [Chloroflexota bacterium]